MLRKTVPTMSAGQKQSMKNNMLAQIKKECVECHKKGMDLDHILAPSYQNKDFMIVLGQLGINYEELKNIVVGYIEEYEKNKS